MKNKMMIMINCKTKEGKRERERLNNATIRTFFPERTFLHKNTPQKKNLLRNVVVEEDDRMSDREQKNGQMCTNDFTVLALSLSSSSLVSLNLKIVRLTLFILGLCIFRPFSIQQYSGYTQL